MKQLVHLSVGACLLLSLLMLCRAQKPELVVQTGHSGVVVSVAFSPDGRLLASGSGDNTVKLWEVASHRVLRTLTGQSKSTDSVAFSPDGKLLASASGLDRTVKLWDVVTGLEVRTLKTANADQSLGAESIAFNADGTLLATGGTTIKLWEVGSGRELRTLAGHSQWVNSVVFNPNGNVLASGSSDHTIKLWNVDTGQELSTLSGHLDSVNSVAFSGDGKLLASASNDKTIKLWDVSTGRELKTFTGHSIKVSSVAFMPQGAFLASDDEAGIIKVWDVATGRELRAPSTHPSEFHYQSSVAFSADGKILAGTSSDEAIRMWDVAKGEALPPLSGHSRAVELIALSGDGKTLASTSRYPDKTIKLWDLTTGRELNRLMTDSHSFKSVAFSPDGKTLAGAGDDRTVKLWEVSTGRELRTFTGHTDEIRSLAFSPDGRLLVTAGADWTVRLWEVATGRELRIFKGKSETTLDASSTQVWSHSITVFTVAFSPDGKSIASGDLDGFIKLWDVATGRELSRLRHSKYFVSSLAFDAAGKTLASASGDETVKLWEVATGREVRTLDGHSDALETVAFSPDGKTLATGGWDDTITLWDVASGHELHTLKEHTSWVNSVVFTADGRFLLSGSWDTTIKLWRVDNGELQANLIAFDKQDWTVITPDGLFDGSPAAWDNILWRFDHNTFNYASVEAFFGDFYYPGLLTDILAGKHPQATSDISQKDRRQPQLKLAMADAQAEAQLTARSVKMKIDVWEAPADKEHKTGGGAQDVRLFRNGGLIKVWHGDVLQGQNSVTLEATVPIVAGENRLTAYAFNHDNIKSTDASFSVNGADRLKDAGTLYILAIGSNKYQSAGYDLKFALADVDEISKQVRAYQDKLGTYARTEIISLTDREATKANIMLALRRFAEGSEVKLPPGVSPTLKQRLEKISNIEPEDGLMIYYAGHGTAIGEHFYLLPHDFVASNEKQLKATSISDSELNEVLEGVDASRLLMVIDACQSGQALGGEKEGRGPMNSKGLAQLAYDKGMYILTAAQSYQAAKEVSRSQVGQKIEHGLLTFALLEGLGKARKDNEGKITEREWMNYAVEQVPLMQVEEMKKRSVVVRQRGRQQPSRGSRSERGAELVFIDGDNARVDPDQRNVQRPRVFYRRELETQPLIIAKP